MTAKVLLISSDAHIARRLMAPPSCGCGYRLMVAATKAEALFHLRTDHVGVLAADESGLSGDALALLEQAAREHPDVARIYMASQIDLPKAIQLVNRVGVFRVLPKPTHTDDFSLAVAAALNAQTARTIGRQVNGQHYANTTLDSREPAHFLLTADIPMDGDEGQPLSRREKEILLAVIEGRKPADIARLYFISVHTARNHIKALYRKLGVHSQVELIAKVLRTDSGRARPQPGSQFKGPTLVHPLAASATSPTWHTPEG